jgi:predicted small lipoprotein YifL
MKQTGKIFVAIATVATLAAGCQPGPEDAPPQDDTEQSEAVAREVGQSIVKTGGAVAMLAEPLARALEDDGTTAADGPLKQKIEAAIAKLVAATECLSFDWVPLTLEATVHFDSCTIPTTSTAIDGSITVVARPLKLQVFVETDSLTIGDDTFYGAFTAYLAGPLAQPTVGVDFDVTHEDSATTLAVDGLTITGNLQGVTVGGAGVVMSDKIDASANADAVRWNTGDCAPTSGTIEFAEGSITGTITFLETTPSTGNVLLDLPLLPPYELPLFPACG